MNFSLHKAFYKKTLVASILFLSLVLGFFRCVGIEDLLPPTIGNFTLQAEYNVTDTIFIDANLFDNFALGKVSVIIEPLDPNGNFSLDRVLKDNVGARLLKLERYPVVVIPANATLGEYKMTLTVTDVVTETSTRVANQKKITQNFMVGGDNGTPAVPDLDLNLDLNIALNPVPSLLIKELADGSYQACRSSVIPISGTASDNVALSSISAQFIGYPNTFKEFLFSEETISIGLDTLFDGIDAIKIPNEASNGTTINLVITVKDNVGNEGIATISFKVDCDDQSPIIERIDTNLPLNSLTNRVDVIQGQNLFINGGLVRDRLGNLKDLSVYFNTSTLTNSLKTWWINRESIELISLDSIPFPIPIPSTATVGTIYDIRVVATDFGGNNPDIDTIKIEIRQNEFPTISTTATEVNGIGRYFRSNRNAPLIISTGSTIRFIGKIREDVELENYRITWGIEGDEQVIIEENISSNDIPIDRFFETNQNARVGTRYVLTIYARDTFQQVLEVKYYFIVQ